MLAISDSRGSRGLDLGVMVDNRLAPSTVCERLAGVVERFPARRSAPLVVSSTWRLDSTPFRLVLVVFVAGGLLLIAILEGISQLWTQKDLSV